MTAFLFIPTTIGNGAARRVDFVNIASLFVEAEEPARRSSATGSLLRIAAAAALLLLLVIGDALLVTRPGGSTGLPAAPSVAVRAML